MAPERQMNNHKDQALLETTLAKLNQMNRRERRAQHFRLPINPEAMARRTRKMRQIPRMDHKYPIIQTP